MFMSVIDILLEFDADMHEIVAIMASRPTVYNFPFWSPYNLAIRVSPLYGKPQPLTKTKTASVRENTNNAN